MFLLGLPVMAITLALVSLIPERPLSRAVREVELAGGTRHDGHRQERQHYSVTLAVLAVAALSFALLQTLVAPALPEIQRELGASTTASPGSHRLPAHASIATPMLGRLGDMFGKDRMLVIVLVVLALGLADRRAVALASRC